MKLLAVFVALLSTGCYALSNPQGAAQSVKMIDLKNQHLQSHLQWRSRRLA
jgi:hypothetical protein